VGGKEVISNTVKATQTLKLQGAIPISMMEAGVITESHLLGEAHCKPEGAAH